MQKCATIDIETTGRAPGRHQILEIACVIETDWSTQVDLLPAFRALVRPDGDIVGEPEALLMNERLIREIARGGGVGTGRAVQSLGDFLAQHLPTDASITLGGKNFGCFDLQFLKLVPEWSEVHHAYRFFDVGNMWWRPEVDRHLPDLKTCVQRAGIAPRSGHEALEDCRTVIECVRAWHQRENKAA